jgi:hypothetical protein
MAQASTFTADSLAAHMTCAVAGVRDGLRAAQFYARDLANADGEAKDEARDAPFLSRAVGLLARLTDRFLSWGARTSIRIIYPGWRNLPSPFAPGVLRDVITAISHNSFTQNPRFNAYFFRAADHIISRYCDPPALVLEHRVDAARRALAGTPSNEGNPSEFLARTLIALVRHGAVARIGKAKPGHQFFAVGDPNVSVFAIACVALMFAAEGKPSDVVDDDEFFEVTGALIGPRLPRMADLIAAGDELNLARELTAIKAMY